ncbi:MAG: addiction module antidote protein [Gammaproteobacteria bacterium]
MAKKSLSPALPYRDWLIKHLKSRKNAAAYLEAAIQEGDTAALMQALRNIADAHGGIGAIAQETGLRRETLYRTLSKTGNPQLKSLSAILAAVGLKLSVKPAA